ncbi:cupin domain-containing protein [Microbispora sp. RL4-1S]|uniref:Cupin domain-containing protein n=1 Tax=Microbispora oryzae TaxID=2806554 RepID=A0A941AR44_9ACTN|nr:cupin domain-containing protein [Microbispora oryzae]MBP2705509.1 cupin domain-containing protein [Microbispora oryzae]
MSLADSTARTVSVLRNLLSPESLDAVEWKEWRQPGRAGVEIHSLAKGPRAEAFLVRYGPGAHGDLHRHLGFEVVFVLDGEMINDNGDRYTRGDLVVEDADSVHQIETETGFTVLAFREAPTEPVAGANGT